MVTLTDIEVDHLINMFVQAYVNDMVPETLNDLFDRCVAEFEANN